MVYIECLRCQASRSKALAITGLWVIIFNSQLGTQYIEVKRFLHRKLERFLRVGYSGLCYRDLIKEDGSFRATWPYNLRTCPPLSRL